MKILVTGGAGFIGSHTVVELQQQGHEVWIADNLSNSHISVLDGITAISGRRPRFFQTDLCDVDALANVFSTAGRFDGVIHFAAFKAVGESVNAPLKYYRNNLLSTLNLMKCMQDAGCSNLVFSSSCTVYGQPDELPVRETSPIKPAISPYGNTKQMAEEMITDTTRVSDLKAILLRYFNPIGAHHTALIGELPLGVPNNLVPFITQTAIGIRPKLLVFGDDYPTSDGTCIRDYIHVVDLAKAHIAALERMAQGRSEAACEIFNVGTGKGSTVLEVIAAFEKVSGRKLNYEITGRRTGDVDQVWADTTKANSVLGWKAQKSLDDMMLSAWNWELALKSKKS